MVPAMGVLFREGADTVKSMRQAGFLRGRSRHLLAIYELNDIRILQEVFIQAYERLCRTQGSF